MPSNAKQRKARYTIKYDGQIIGNKFAATKQLAVNQESEAISANADLEARVKSLVQSQVKTGSEVLQYFYVAESAQKLASKWKTSALNLEASLLKFVWVKRGLDADLIDDVFLLVGIDVSKLEDYAGFILRIISIGGTFDAPTGAESEIIWEAPQKYTAINVRAYRKGGTGGTVNARKNGVDLLLASDLSLSSPDIWMDGGLIQNASFAVGDTLELMVTGTSGSPDEIVVQVNFMP